MSDTFGSALIEIQPDFSRFEALLKSALEASIRKVEASASSTLKVDVQVAEAKALEKSFGNIENLSSGLAAQFDKINDAMNQVVVAVKDAAKSLFIASKLIEQMAKNTKEIKFQDISQQTSGFRKFLDVISLVSNILGNIVSIGANVATLVSFGKTLKLVGADFKINRQEAEGFRQQLTALTSSFTTNIPAAKKVQEGVAGAAKVFTNATGAASNLGRQTQFLQDDTKKLGRSFTSLVTSGKKAEKSIVDIQKVAKPSFGPGTSSLNEFGANSQSIFARVSLFAKQAFQNIGFHISQLRERLGSLGEGFSALGAKIGIIFNLFLSLGRGAESIGGFFANLAGKINGLREKLGEGGGGLAGVLSLVGSRLLALGPGALAGIATAGIALVTAGVSKAIIGLAQKASRLQESVNAVSVTLDSADEPFKKLIGDVTKLGLSQLELNESITPIVPLLRGAGLEGDALADKLNQLVRRGVDLGSIFNKTSAEVLPALGAAIRGEIEPARALGISFNAAAVEARALADGAVKVDGQLSEEVKSIARLNLVLEKSQFAANDYANTQTSLANATRNFRSVLTGLSFAFSDVFLPASEKITSSLNKLVSTAGPGIIRFFQTIKPLVTDFGEIIADLLISGLGQSFLEASAAASEVFLPVLQSVLLAVRGVLQVFEVFNVVLGHVLPGNLNILTALFIKFLVMKQIALLTRVLTGAFVGLGIAAGGASTGLGKALGATAGFLGTVGKFAGIIGVGITVLGAMGDKVEDTTTLVSDLKKEMDSDLLGKFLDVGVKSFGEQSLVEKVFGVPGTIKAAIKEFGVLGSLTKGADDILPIVEANKIKERFERAFSIDPDFAEKIVQEAERTRDKMAPVLRTLFNDLNIQPIKTAEEALVDLVETRKLLADAFSSSQTAIEGLISAGAAEVNANKALSSANKSLASATKAVRDIEADRARILRETISPLQEIVDAQEALARVGFRLRDLGQEQLDIERQLVELRAPATADELAAADRSVERAKIALNKALREEIVATQELNEEQAVQVDLSGLSVDQIKSRLSNIRATLAAQQATKKVQTASTEGSKTQAEIDEGNLERKLTVLDSEQALRDAEKEREEIRDRQLNNGPQVRELEERLVELAFDKADAAVDQGAAEKTLNTLKAGETTLSKALTALEQEKKAALEGQKSAQEAVTTAKQALLVAAAEQDVIEARILGNKTLEITAEMELLRLKKEQAGVSLEDEATINRQLTLLGLQAGKIKEASLIPRFPGITGNIIPDTLQGTTFEHVVTSGLVGGGINDVAINALAQALLQTQALKQFILPGGARALMAGGIVEGTPGPMGTLIRAGEYGRAEAVLPLRNPANFFGVLHKSLPYAHPAIRSMIDGLHGDVLNDAPRISLTGPESRISALRTHRTQPQPSSKPSTLERKLDRLIQLQEEANGKTFEINAPISVTSPDSQLAARRTARELRKMLDSL